MAIPWSKIISMSPSIVEGGRVLWKAVAQRQARVPSAPAREDSAAAVEVRLHALEKKVVQLGEEATASFEVVKSVTEQHSRLAEHHAELVRAVDALLGRTRLLVWLTAILAFVLVAVLALVAVR